jgi:hypothetical protein
MRSTFVCSVAVSVVAVGIATAGVRVALDKVPPPAVKAVKDRYPKAEIRFADKEGGNRYELAMKEGERQFDVTVTAEGKVTHVKEDVAVKAVPDAVKEALKKKYPGSEIAEAEKVITVDGDKEKTVYEIVVKAGKESHSVVLDPAGKFVGTAD